MKRTRFFAGLVLAPFIFVTSAEAVVSLDDGAIHEISTLVEDYIYVDDGPGDTQTTLIIQAGADIDGSDGDDDSIALFGNSVGIFNGGSVSQDVYVEGTASVTVSGGSFEDDFQMFDTTTATFTGGTLSDTLELYDDSNVFISGGTFNDVVELYDDSYLEITGGTFRSDLRIDSTLVIRGGDFLMEDITYGLASAGGLIVLDGSNFMLDGVSIVYGDLTAVSGQLTGMLADGSLLDVTVNRDPLDDLDRIGRISLVPEPSMLGLIVGLGAFSVAMIRRRR